MLNQEVCYTVCVILLTMFLLKKSSMFRFYAKFLTFLISSFILGTVFIPLMFSKPGDYRNANGPAWGLRQIAKLLGMKWTMRGKKNIVQDEGTIVLMNHQSALDLIVLAHIWPVLERCTVIAKREVFYLWPFGLAAWLWGTVFIDRSRTKDAKNSVNKAATSIMTRRSKICIFPEGTRHDGDELLPFKKGAFHMAIESQCPIQPIVLSKYKFLEVKNLRFDEGPVILSILPAISTVGLKKEDIDGLIEKTHKAMSEEYQRLNSEV